MKSRSLFRLFCLSAFCLIVGSVTVFAQRPGSTTPRQEKLLNGLKLLMWNDASASDVKVRIRIHSGSAFDPQGKEGVMQLLADNIFPTSAARTYFSEDLGGSLEVITNYDYIQVNASAKSSEFVTLFETLAQAVSNPAIDKETTATLKKALAERLAILEKDPAYIADQAAAKRLFGTFPYGRPQMGSTESLQRIDFADLLFAKERFLSADNVTVAISGNFNPDLGFRAARRYFGAWLKSDKRVPSTFRQPDAPQPEVLKIPFLEGRQTLTSFAIRGLARSDSDYLASLILENVLRARVQRIFAESVVGSEARVLPGVLTIRAPGFRNFPTAVLTEPVSQAEFSKGLDEATAYLSKRSAMDIWLDADTYGSKVLSPEKNFQSLTQADVQRVADRFSKGPVATVVVMGGENIKR